MAVQALGYLGIGTRRAFRVDDHRQRVVVDKERPDAERFFGWDGPRLTDSPFAPSRFLASRRSAGRCVQ
jgi:hypothetical protein